MGGWEAHRLASSLCQDCRLISSGKGRQSRQMGPAWGQVAHHSTWAYAEKLIALSQAFFWENYPRDNFFKTSLEAQVMKHDEANYRLRVTHRSVCYVCSYTLSGLSQGPSRVLNYRTIQKLTDLVCQTCEGKDAISFGFATPTMPAVVLTHRTAPTSSKRGISGLWYLHLVTASTRSPGNMAGS